MKRLILFMTVLLLSLGANAASINITNYDTYYASVVGIVPNNASTAVASFSTDGGEFAVQNNVTSDVNTWAKVEWTFNPEGNFSGGVIDLSNNDFMNIYGDYSYTLYMLAGHQYWLDLFNGLTSDAMGFQLSVSTLSQVPVPAALWLLLPALIGFFGLRRQLSSSFKGKAY